MGAEVKAVTAGTQVLEDTVAATFQDLAQNLDTTFYLVGSAVGPYPYPQMVERFQRVISKEARQQFLNQIGRLPDAVITCVGGGSNAIGAFGEFIPDKEVRLIGAEGAGKGG